MFIQIFQALHTFIHGPTFSLFDKFSRSYAYSLPYVYSGLRVEQCFSVIAWMIFRYFFSWFSCWHTEKSWFIKNWKKYEKHWFNFSVPVSLCMFLSSKCHNVKPYLPKYYLSDLNHVTQLCMNKLISTWPSNHKFYIYKDTTFSGSCISEF